MTSLIIDANTGSRQLGDRRGRRRGTDRARAVCPMLPVDTDWDLGVSDSTTIWFTQSLPP